MPTHTSKLIFENLELYEERLMNSDLNWCQQLVSLLDGYQKGEFSINDLDCN